MKVLYGIILISLLFFSISCQKIKDSILSEEKQVSVICLVDFSNSIPETTVKDYKDVIKTNIFRNLSFKDKILILPIDKGSKTSSVEIFSLDFEKYNFEKELASPTQKEQVEKRGLELFKDSILIKFDSLFNLASQNRQQYNSGTDVIGALSECNKYLTEKSQNIIILFSDMIQETEKINLPQYTANVELDKLIEKTDAVKLTLNSDLIVLTGEQPGLSAKQYDLTKYFWTKYFQKCNLNLLDYSSGGRKVLSDKISDYHNK